MKKFIVIMMIVLGIHAFQSNTSLAQIYDPSSQSQFFPYRNPPPLSPWLELERATTSSELGSYHQFVKPRLEMQRMIEAQQRLLYRQNQSQMQIQERVQGLELTQTEVARPTGRKVRYLDYGHFYPRKIRK